MNQRLWTFQDLQRFLRYEDPEVRFWAADRMVRHYPDEAPAALAAYLFDEHEMTPELVAAHLGRHGGGEHLAALARAARTHRGLAAARALQAMIRLRAPDAINLVRSAYDRKDFDEECWSELLEALAERGDGAARATLEAVLKNRADWVGSPPVLRSALRVAETGAYRLLLQGWIRSLQWSGAGGSGLGPGAAGEAFRVLMDHLQVDDCGWCFRTSLSGRIDLHRTLKAIESSYDCELRDTLGADSIAAIGAALDAGVFEASVAALVAAVKRRAAAIRRAPGDDLIDRIVEVTVFWSEPDVVRSVEGLGPHLAEWVIGFLLSVVVATTRYRNYELEVRRAAGDPTALLDLLTVESSCLIDRLPQAIVKAVETAGPTGGSERSAVRRAAEERGLQILAAHGPFFPQAMALELLGELRSVGAVNEMIDFLGEENAYLYEAAEHALGKMGDAVIEAARARLEADNIEEDAGHSLLILLCETGSPEAVRLVLDQFDLFVEAAGAGDAARWMSLLGARELIAPLRRVLKSDTAMVGQALLLLGAIHNVRIPEEAAIRRAIDDYWKQRPEDEGVDGPGGGDGSDKYLM
jgi:hypothetical protein